MPAPISIATVIEKNKANSSVAILTLMKIEVWDEITQNFVETFYLVRNDEPFNYNGNEYIPYPFDFQESKEAGSEPSITLAFKDVTGAIKQRMQRYRGAVDSLVTIMVVPSNAISGTPEISMTFRVISSGASDFDVSWELGARKHLATKFPKRVQMKDRCSWKYKGIECGYTGPLPTCDYTLQGANGCAIHANTARFGGFPGLNA